MRSAVILGCLCLLGCPPSKPLPAPEPSGRCEVDLAASGFFANVGNGARAKAIESADELIGGSYAQAQVGDYLLENDRIRVVIQRPNRMIAPAPYGGTLIDADIQRPAGEAGRDSFGKVELFYAFGRTINVNKVEVLNDGAAGGYAVIAATGPDEVMDYLNIPNVVENYLGEGVKLSLDPNLPLPIVGTTYYVLSPGESRVRMLTALCNQGKDTIVVSVGDVVDRGGDPEYFNPTSCAKGFGAKNCLIDPASWFGFQSTGVAYGYRASKLGDPRTVAVNAMLAAAGISGVLIDGESAQGLVSWFDPTATRRPGSFGMLAGQSRSFIRDFFVGRDLGEITGEMLAIDQKPTSRLSVIAQLADGTPVPGARIAVVVAETSAQVTALEADATGKAKVNLAPGNYLVSTGQQGHALEAATAVTVPAIGEAQVTVTLGATRTLTVTVKDPFLQGLPARVVVTCPTGPCTSHASNMGRFRETEDLPSTIQAIAFSGADGVARVALPPGAYEVMVTRGPEYSAFPDTYPLRGAAVDLTSADGAVAVTLARVVDTTGWQSADLHVHAVNSPDSTVPNALRVASFAAEGVDVLTSTDHDYVTDFAPLIQELGLGGSLTSMIGCEVTPFDYGHQQAYPVTRDPSSINGGAFDWAGGDGPSLRLDQLYTGLKERYPDVVLQMNHPRGAPGGSLTMLKVDTATGATKTAAASLRMVPHPEATATDTKLLSPLFDVVEVMNGPNASTAVLNDWMTFLSRGWVKAATGTSDSHEAFSATAGYGRTWVHTGVDAPAQFSPSAFAQALKQRKAIGSSGPFVTVTAQRLVSGTPTGSPVEIGGTLSVPAGATVQLTVDIQAPEWMQFDQLELYTHAPGREAVNGEANTDWPESRVLERRSLNGSALPLEAVPGLNGFVARRVHVVERFTVTPAADTWYVVMVRGSSATRTLYPLAFSSVSCSGGVCTASEHHVEAFTNPILVDADGSGAYDTFPLRPGQPLTRAKPKTAAARRVPTFAELEAFVAAMLRHDHSGAR
ncbi:MAG: CehA/McbA family metallohydrolase [Archangium sp.]|nr:CehA/McbA family metallohydrolase [Archangium sp.]